MNPDAAQELYQDADGLDCLGAFTDRGMTKLLAGLGRAEPSDWSERVTAAGTDLATLLPRLTDRDPEVRAAVTQVFEWCWDDAGVLVDHLRAHLRTERDRRVRLGALLAAARLTAVDPDAEQAAEAWLARTASTSSSPLDQFGAGLGLARFVRAEVPDALVDTLATTLAPAYDPYLELFGDGAHLAVLEALDDELAAELRFVLGTSGKWRPPGFGSMAGSVLSACHRPDADAVDALDVVELMHVVAAIAADPEAGTDARRTAARDLAGLPPGVTRPVAGKLAVAAAAQDEHLRAQAMLALARTGDARALPPLIELIEDNRRELHGLGQAIADLRGYADELLPAITRRLDRVAPAEVEFLDGGLNRFHGGLEVFDLELIQGLAQWGAAAIPVVPRLERIRTEYLAEQLRCAGRLAADYYPLWNGIRVVEQTLERIGPPSGR
ncbi:hypothetical protein [Kribbella endophytica]